jgi:hypothetical protein
MANEKRPGNQPSKPSRRTLRLTFKVTDGNFELLSQESLEMITPQQAGERPEAGTHSGLWMELQDDKKRVLAHRILNPEQLNSVEVHSPDGTIERTFGEARDGIFVVLLPDDDEGRSAVLVGDPLVRPKARGKEKAQQGSGELARFELPRRGKGGE